MRRSLPDIDDVMESKLSAASNPQYEEYSYDAWGRMKQSTVKGVTANYTYNATGLRQSKTSGGVTTTHVYDGQNIVMDYTSTGSMQTFIRGNGLIARKIGDTKEYYHQNIHGEISRP